MLFVFLAAGPSAFFCAVPADEDQFRFASRLYDIKEYYRAIGEFDRLLYFFPSTKHKPEALFLTGLSYYRAGRFPEAEKFLGSLSAYPDFAFKAAALSADALFRQGRYEASRAGYAALKDRFPEREPELLLSMSWADLMRKDFSGCLELYGLILQKYPSFERKYDVEYLQKSVGKLKDFKGLSPVLAASLSAVIPGAGQVYTKRPGDGLVAFGAVAILGAGSYLLWRYYGHKEAAVVVTLAAGFFYCGNIYSAWSSAKKYNVLYYRKSMDTLRNDYWSDYDR